MKHLLGNFQSQFSIVQVFSHKFKDFVSFKILANKMLSTVSPDFSVGTKELQKNSLQLV